MKLSLPLLLVALAARAQGDGGVAPPRQVLVRAVPDKIHLGEHFVFQVVVTHDQDQRVDLRVPGDLGDFDLVESRRSRIEGSGTSTTTFDLSLSAFVLGKQQTPAFTFDVNQQGLNGAFAAPTTEIEVLSSLPPDVAEKGAGIIDIRPPVELPIRTWRLLAILAALLAAAGLGWAVVRWLKRPRAVAPVAVKAPEPLHVRAIASLDKLRAEDLPGKARSREFYFRLSEILRGYLGERYTFEALESTSSELLDSLRTLHTPGLQMKELTHFVFDSDLAKFAKATPAADECKASLEFAYSVVYATTPALAPADANRPAQLQ